MTDGRGTGPLLPAPPAEAVEAFGEHLDLAVRYAGLLATTGIDHGLVGPRETPRLWERHLVNCAVLGQLVPQGAAVADIGSGAGLPGLVLAIARPDLTLHLIEPLLRRTTWLETTMSELDLENVTIHRGRADEVEIVVPIVTARAVASLDKLVTWSIPLLETGGRLLALKGAAAADELAAATPMLSRLGVPRHQLHVLGEGRMNEPVRIVEIVRPEQDRGAREPGAGSAGGGRRRGSRGGARRGRTGRHPRSGGRAPEG